MSHNQIFKLDVLAIGAHPDDVEVGAGGLVRKWAVQGRQVGIIDLTRGESASNGDVPTRQTEAAKGSAVLGAAMRANLEMPCGFIETNKENILTLIQAIRQYQPEIILSPYWHDRHSDHVVTSELVTRAAFRSGLVKIDTNQPPHKAQKVFYYALHYEFQPSFIVDISAEFETKMTAVQAHVSQFNSFESSRPTRLNQGGFLEFLEARARVWGGRIGVKYGEPYIIHDGFVGVADPNQLLTNEP